MAGALAIGGNSGVVGAETGDRARRVIQQDECVFQEALDSVVTVRVFDGQDAELVLGSGWVYDLNGSTADIVTNWHVVARAAGADVRFAQGDWRAAPEGVGFDPYSDLAVIRAEDVPEYVEPLSVVETPPEQGDAVAALGAPLGLESTITTGTVSAVDRATTVGFEEFQYTVPSTIQTDAATNPGNSGGPLVDCDGDVVGVNFAGVPPLLGENLNFAVSASMVRRIVPEIVTVGFFRHPYMGLHGITLSPTMSRINDLDETTEGVLVEGTVDGFPADEQLQGSDTTDRETGVPVGGDVIVTIDDTNIHDTDALRNYLFEETSPGETVTLSVLRDGDAEEIELELEAKPLEPERIGIREPTI
ncbi:S1C family serine protease [Natrialbaceae archaeon A-gly3]